MNTLTMARTILALGCVALVLTLLALVLPLDRGGEAGAALPRHVILGIGATLLQSLAQAWLALFLGLTQRAIRVTVAEIEGQQERLREARTAFWSALPWIVLCLVAVIANFVVGARGYVSPELQRIHHWLAWAVLVVQPVALAMEYRAVLTSQRSAMELAVDPRVQSARNGAVT